MTTLHFKTNEFQYHNIPSIFAYAPKTGVLIYRKEFTFRLAVTDDVAIIVEGKTQSLRFIPYRGIEHPITEVHKYYPHARDLRYFVHMSINLVPDYSMFFAVFFGTNV